jgi:uncharacterized protein YbjQ (UPF0145 family)
MPLSGDVMATAVLAEIGGEVTADRREAFQKMCRAIVQHIQANAVVTVNVTGTATGVTPGPAAVPVAGVGTGKVL